MQCYDVLFYNNKIGEVFVSAEGLYKRIRCTCKLPDKSIWRLIALSEGKKTDIGVCIPGETFAINKRLSGKQINYDAVQFIIENNNDRNDSQYVSIENDKPFLHIKQLEDARFLRIHDKPKICISPVSKKENHQR